MYGFPKDCNNKIGNEPWIVPVDRYVFTDDDFAPSVITDRPETNQIEKQMADGFEIFSLSSAHAAKPTNTKQTPGYNGCIPVQKITSLPSNSAERPRPKSRRNHTGNCDTIQGVSE
jgi:hypothetical protein